MFTSGVLDVIMEQGIELSYINGVPAGSMCGMNYLSRQVGRALQMNTEYLRGKRYTSFRNMSKSRLISNSDFLFGELSTELVPFDFETLKDPSQKFEVVATKCKTGQPIFFEKGVCTDMYAAVRASCSVPVLSRMIAMEGRKYLDSGISLPTAYKRAMEPGYEKAMVVLTRQHGYRKRSTDRLTERGYDKYFESLPELQVTLGKVPERYSRVQEEMGELEVDGKLFVIRPELSVMVSRMKQDAKKLRALYAEGQRIGEERLGALRKYLGV